MFGRLLYIFWGMALLIIPFATICSAAMADSGQTWYLTSTGKYNSAPMANDGKTHSKDNLMNKDSRTGDGTYFTLSSDHVAWFYADTGAQCYLAFGENPWYAHIRTRETVNGDEIGSHLTVDICKLAKDSGDVTILASHTEPLTEKSAGYDWNFTCIDNGDTIQEFNNGDWLAIRLSWDCSTDGLQIYYKAEEGFDSYIEVPISEPSYPTPELPTILLLSAGIVFISGYLWLRHKIQKAAST